MDANSFRVLVWESLGLLCGDALQHFGQLGDQHPLVPEVALSPSLEQGPCNQKIFCILVMANFLIWFYSFLLFLQNHRCVHMDLKRDLRPTGCT